MARRMSLTAQISTLDGRVERIEVRLEGVEGRLERVEERVESLEGKLHRFEVKVDERFDQVDAKFARVDERFDDMRGYAEVLTEAMRSDFRNLYDLVFAHMQETNARLNDQQADHQSLERRVTVLEAPRKS